MTAQPENIRKVVISSEDKNLKIVEVSQRDLYAKYRWPAAPTIQQHLQIFKEEYD